ncbi:uncharacterized protein BDR25DRAFT_262280 [Lindgomyces ingoldianus]|uniref:Uncharacterized protein n=1 Tax=Lindgomyces ingoldianus TaxID=673940 RepID=A0ACB6QTQ3_9PLEO|nr:uncharacterized protein BDR25DRAFT_262280 [Lindgomyces ingoldianus]KAF2470404.1 hypothetical protein BDR25DRAFT_262280 [Lindgomyces ingoldianus]
MPDKGWRKKIAAGRPKTPIPPVATIPPKVPTEDSGVGGAEEPIGRRRQSDKLGWRKTIHGSRPNTPVGITGPTTAGDDGEDSRSEHGSESSTPRRRSTPKPKLKHYLSSYLTLTAPPTSPEFSEPWHEDSPFDFIPPVDPIIVLQSVHSYLCGFPSQPLPVQHNNGLLRVFEDYKKAREQKERLDQLLQETFEDYRSAEERWLKVEDCYQAEIRRLELIIARGTTGMAGLIKARQESVVKRKRTQRRAQSMDRLETAFEFLTQDQLDQEIILRSQKVLLHRPSSRSGQMAALSRQFSNMGSYDGLSYGTPPSQERKITLSRKVKSELDLTKMANVISTSDSTSRSVCSEFSATGDPLPDEAEPSLDTRIESDAFVALRDLAILVARRRGINPDRFLSKLLKLFSTVDDGDVESGPGSPKEEATQLTLARMQDTSIRTPNRSLRHFRSQPQLSSDRSRRRHFSFEPGDDELALLEERLETVEMEQDKSHNRPPLCPDRRSPLSDVQSQGSSSRPTSLYAEVQKPSKIPSPINGAGLGSVRRESSVSSLQTVFGRPNRDDDRRRDSRSSVLTAFHQHDNGSQRPQSTSRSSSINNLRQAESPFSSGSLRVRNSMAALAAARAAEASTSESKSNSPARNSRRGSSNSSTKPQRRLTAAKRSSENDIPQKSS